MLTVPNPTVPTNGQTGDADLLRENLEAVYQELQSYDASQIATGTLVEAAFAATVNPRARFSETGSNFVASGCVWSGDSYGGSLNGSMTSGVIYVNGYRLAVSSISAHAFTASKDTYVDIDYLGNITYTEASNNAASPALAANSLRLAIIVSGAGSIAAAGSVNQGQEGLVLPIASSIPYQVSDSLGNLICNRSSRSGVLSVRQITSNQTIASSTPAQVAGISCPVIVPTGRKIKITVSVSKIANNSASGSTTLTIWDGVVNSGTQLQGATFDQHATVSEGVPAFFSVIVTPTSTSKTYNLGNATNGTGTSTLIGSSTAPTIMTVELI